MPKYEPLQYALSLLKLRDRTVGEMRDKMRRKGYLGEEVEQVIAKLLEKDLLNDQRFAESYLRSQVQYRPSGRHRIRAKMKQLFLSDQLIQSVMSGYDVGTETEKAKDLTQRWLAKKAGITDDEIRQKLGRFLSSRGFDWEVVREVLDRIKNGALQEEI
ncbi:MAG: Regulatory protein RecX [bacterium ADurb.Bin400]|nr:MAG: Regulatory protein RecX [bacterium ADurb.Bin400]